MPIVTPNTSVASKGTGSVSSGLAQFQRYLKSNPAAIPDPRADVMATVGAVPEMQPNPEVERGIPVLESSSTIETEQDIADASGAPYAPMARSEVILDETGQPVLDEMGQKQYRVIENEDYNSQLALEQQSHFSIKEGVQQMAAGDQFGGMRTALEGQYEAAQTGWGLNSRDEFKLENKHATLDQFIQSEGSTLEAIQANARDSLFGGEDGTRSKALIEDGEGKFPVGWKVLADSGLEATPENREILNTLAGLSFMQALTQAGVHRTQGQQSEVKDSSLGSQEVGKDYQSNMINATAHALKKGLDGMSMKLSDNAADLMAKAIVLHNEKAGYLIASPSENGRVVLDASPTIKQRAMRMQRLSEAITGDLKRSGASDVPTVSGTTFTRGRTGTTKGAVTGEDVVTKTADLVKGIHGAIAQVFRAKDVKRKKYELEQCMKPEFAVYIDDQFAYSTHPFAVRNNIHQGAYKAAFHKVKRPLDFDAKNPVDVRAYEAKQKAGALKAMGEILALIEFDGRNVEKTTGIKYSHWIHSTSNQRFYPNSYNTDYMGSKNIIRDVMALADQDTVRAQDLFNPQAIAIMKRRASYLMSGHGLAVHKKLTTEATPNELGAIGAMRNAVMYYYTALNPGEVKNIAKYSPLQVIQMYTPEIGARLADLGMKYNAFMADTENTEPDHEMMSLWVATEKGEALGTINLWDDFFKAKTMAGNPRDAGRSFALTHHAFSDGNQNGIFLQALFYGLKDENQSFDAGLRLSKFNPSMLDMRMFGMESMINQLQETLADSPEKWDAWDSFFKEAFRRHGKEKVAKDFFKVPLMQNAYGKDAAMFKDFLMDLMEVNDDYSSLAEQFLTGNGVYETMADAGLDLGGAVEATLRAAMDGYSNRMMKGIGRMGAVTNNPFKIPGISEDTIVIVPVGSQPVNRSVVGAGQLSEATLPDGRKVILKTPKYLSDTLINPDTGEVTELPTYRVGPNPNDTRGTQYFWSRKKQQYDEFGNALGTMMSRQFAVLMIQALDGDLVKYTTLEANKDRVLGTGPKRNPWPVLFVHDSIIGTAGSSLIYDNVYNNVAIPAAIPKIAEMGKRIQNALHLMMSKEKAKVKERDEPVGIGAQGDYPSLGAVFDEIYERTIEKGQPEDYQGPVMPNDYKGFYLSVVRAADKRKKAKQKSLTPDKAYHAAKEQESRTFAPTPEGAWEKKKTQMQSFLKEAESLGWIYPGDMPEKARELLTIPPENFARLMDLAAEYLGMDDMKAWTDDHARRVNIAWDVLKRNTREHGIGQMTAGGGTPIKGEGYNPKPLSPVAKPMKAVKAEVAKPIVPPPGTTWEDVDDEVPF